MSYISPRPEQSTDAEIALLESLFIATPTPPGEFFYSPAPGVIASAVPVGTGTGVTSGQNLGSGAGVFKEVSGNTMRFKSLKSTDGSVDFTVDEDSIDFSVIAASGYDTREYQYLTGTTSLAGGDSVNGKGYGSYYLLPDDDYDGLPFYESVIVKRIILKTAYTPPVGTVLPNTFSSTFEIFKDGLSTGFTDTITFDSAGESVHLMEPDIAYASNEKYSIRYDIPPISRLNASVITGLFTVGEVVTGSISGATGIVNAQVSQAVIVEQISGLFVNGDIVTGSTSGAFTNGISSQNYGIVAVNYATIVQVAGGDPLGVQGVTAEDSEDIDNTDPFNPILVPALKRVKVTITSAQLLDLHNTPVELIPAPGAGKAIRVLGLVSRIQYATTPYEWDTVTGNGTLGVFIHSESAGLSISNLPVFQALLFSAVDPAVTLACGILSSSADCMQESSPQITPASITAINDSQIFENDPIVISVASSTGSVQLVNGDSDLILYIDYREITL